MAGGKPAARMSDMHICPASDGPVPHVGGAIILGSPNVLIGGLPAARMTDTATCVGPPATITKGSSGVFINGLPAARMGDQTSHGGTIILGNPTVLVGETGGGSGSAGAPAVTQASDTTTSQNPPLTREQVFRRLQDHTTSAARKIDRGPDKDVYSQRQLNAIKKDPDARARFRGSQIDKETRNSVKKDDDLKDRVTGKSNKGPDFIDKDTGDQYDMTTQGQLQAHQQKYGDDLIHLDTSGKAIDPQPPMPPPKINSASPQGPPDTPIIPEDPELPIFDIP